VAAVLDGRDGVATPGGDAMAAVARARGIPLIPSRAGRELRVGGLRLRVLWPHPEPAALHAGEDPNGRATVLEVTAREARALLTADAESEVLGQLALRPVDVLKVSHHGSEDPGLPRVLERLRPRIAGIEVGAGNSYGHPAPSTLAALATVPLVVRTDRDGSVRLDLGPTGRWEVRPHA
jgi:competence protein ComEC